MRLLVLLGCITHGAHSQMIGGCAGTMYGCSPPPSSSERSEGISVPQNDLEGVVACAGRSLSIRADDLPRDSTLSSALGRSRRAVACSDALGRRSGSADILAARSEAAVLQLLLAQSCRRRQSETLREPRATPHSHIRPHIFLI